MPSMPGMDEVEYDDRRHGAACGAPSSAVSAASPLSATIAAW
jgi:hypothetical protein